MQEYDTDELPEPENKALDPDYIFEEEPGFKTSEVELFKEVIEEGMRNGASNCALANYINLTLKAVNMEYKQITASCIKKWKMTIGEQARHDHEESKKGVYCMKFDGKSSDTSFGHKKFGKVDHITVVTEPENKYLDHFVTTGSGVAMAGGLMDIIESTESRDTLEAIGSDGTNGKTLKVFIF